MQTDQNRIWDKTALYELLDTSDKAVTIALQRIFQRQTSAEQAAGETRDHNGRGFNGRDARWLSDIAKRLPRYGNRMTPRQVVAVRKAIKKYWRQLLEEIELKGGRVCYDGESLISEAAPSLFSDPATSPDRELADPAIISAPASEDLQWGIV